MSMATYAAILGGDREKQRKPGRGPAISGGKDKHTSPALKYRDSRFDGTQGQKKRGVLVLVGLYWTEGMELHE